MTSRQYLKNITMLRMAFEISNLSKDVRTKHGCILTTPDYRIISVGYNSYPAGMDDDNLPKDAPDKYQWMIHSEENAIMNSVLPLWSIEGIKAFITGTPCTGTCNAGCAMKLAQVGIIEWHLARRQGTHQEDEKSRDAFNQLICDRRIKIYYYDLKEIEK